MADEYTPPPLINASPERLRQTRQQLGLGTAFQITEATQVLDRKSVV